MAKFYNEASLVLNLTNPCLAIETFGLTPLEAMNCGLPVIVPAVGGIAEMVTDGQNGYKINVQHTDAMKASIISILSSETLYGQLSQGALAQARRYNSETFLEKIATIFGAPPNSLME